MNKLFALCGLVMLGTTSTPQEGINILECNNQEVEVIITTTEEHNPVVFNENILESSTAPKLVSWVGEAPQEIVLDDIVYIEDEESDFDLGFDTAEYLPENFDPYKQYVDLNSIEFIEEGDISDLGFDTSAYLPDDFDPYSIPVDINSVSYIEEGEDEIDLGFDTSEYLPEGFDPHEFYVDLDAIEYIEEEDELEFDFIVQDYLPDGFDPYTK